MPDDVGGFVIAIATHETASSDGTMLMYNVHAPQVMLTQLYVTMLTCNVMLTQLYTMHVTVYVAEARCVVTRLFADPHTHHSLVQNDAVVMMYNSAHV